LVLPISVPSCLVSNTFSTALLFYLCIICSSQFNCLFYIFSNIWLMK
jgi:hypothetical protein